MRFFFLIQTTGCKNASHKDNKYLYASNLQIIAMI